MFSCLWRSSQDDARTGTCDRLGFRMVHCGPREPLSEGPATTARVGRLSKATQTLLRASIQTLFLVRQEPSKEPSALWCWTIVDVASHMLMMPAQHLSSSGFQDRDAKIVLIDYYY